MANTDLAFRNGFISMGMSVRDNLCGVQIWGIQAVEEADPKRQIR